ncbi:hypothetical protein LU631_19255 [Erwinia tracheiphila]|uniref:Uncharacterized protein n=1 Tax=Erwinia tracheiphila TaxID=65700 RepID=A0A0M2K7B2_9GAMM|nr:hypothetical protein [Erwinia tracheiphila]EOS96127.1 hypothetical protein ETR_04429 [Erwinia tracheiphila PSU-1]KKF35280.1 hypothetical protein SY86_07340 [Erwinia tracheiphila]UIA86945.1 hypothetical protein LU631_19255 [Erwinia tracheiphila]UIA95301.1 hypothetical protein LU633_17710 [Erwinia tracheiphila]
MQQTISNGIKGRAASGANSDITSLTGLTTALSIEQGGTGKTSTADAITAQGGLPVSGGTMKGRWTGFQRRSCKPASATVASPLLIQTALSPALPYIPLSGRLQ